MKKRNARRPVRSTAFLTFALGSLAAPTLFETDFNAVSLSPQLVAASEVALDAKSAETSKKIGVRPYEMDWAGRTEEVRPALVDFENLDGWTVEAHGAVATFERSREEQMYGKYVGKLTYRKDAASQETPVVRVRPPQPIPIDAADFDAFSCWIVGNNWAWAPDPKTPRVRVSALFQTVDGQEVPLFLETIDWREWFLCYKTIYRDVRKRLGDKVSFNGFLIENGRNEEARTLYFDSFCVFKEERKPLEFTARPKPGIDLFDGQPLGLNSGEGRLPFPTRAETILPNSSANLKKAAFHTYGDAYDFVYEGTDGTLVYDYKPQVGDWSDVTARWNDSEPFKPLSGGGVNFLIGDGGSQEPVEKRELLEKNAANGCVTTRWKLSSKSATAEVEYRFQLDGKSLIVDVIALGGKIPAVEFGRFEGVENPRTFAIPYYLYDYGRRPGALIFTPPTDGSTMSQADDANSNGGKLFASGHIDWYRSGASYLLGKHEVGKSENGRAYAVVNGASEYRTKTDGTRNDVYERFVLTISPTFEETLPTIANPTSPYKHIAGKGVWRAHGATTRDADKKYWRDVWRRGMRNVIVTDHEVCWRDGGESFTFRTKPAPKKGGDAGWIDYSRFMQDELGFVYGPYNNFTDFAPVNEYWSPDMISRLSDGSLQRAWARCYAPKPARAVEYCEKLTPINEAKFQFSCAYCDVHSSVPAWTRVDYDARVPGAGTFMSVYYPYGEIFLLQKKNWGGPTYSEGPHHCFYSGLTDGNYAQDQPYNLRVNPWLVDFDLRKMHDLECNFGLGNIGMFAPGYKPKTPAENTALLDRFLAGTLAFGHPGFLALDFGSVGAAKSYFMIQQIAARYTQVSATTIRYFDADGNALDASAALAADVVKRSQVGVEYADGTTVVANGSETENLETTFAGRKISLPPNGYVAWTSDGEILVESRLSDAGNRFDYCASPEYVYLDGRGVWTVCERACGAGSGVCRVLDANSFELIPYDGAELGFKIADANEAVSAVALNYDGEELGEAQVRRSRGFTFVVPVDGAFSYRLTKTPVADDVNDANNQTAGTCERWSCERYAVAPGETVVLRDANGQTVDFTIPQDATPNTRIWAEPEAGAFVDFSVVNAVEPSFAFDAKTNVLTVSLKTALPRAAGTFSVENYPNPFNVEGSEPTNLVFPFAAPEKAGTDTSQAFVRATPPQGDALKTVYSLNFETASQFVPFETLDFGARDGRVSSNIDYTPYVQRRGAAPSPSFANSGAQANFQTSQSCGGDVRSGFFLHPPYMGGPTGRTYLRFDFEVPNEPATFRVDVGKKDESHLGDGILFQVAVATFADDGSISNEQTLAETTVAKHEWKPLEADLSAFAGKKVSLLVIADVGKADDSSGDWGVASNPRLESPAQTLVRRLTKIAPGN
ncbi:MAG: hypothetical protein IKU86_07270 [Thermoguttaceae bacterium]|nr:hypothetical protein [Thermoguttaceae bacterium]